MATDVMDGWVRRVLGIDPAPPAVAPLGKVELTKRLLGMKDAAAAAGLGARLLEVRDAVVAGDPGAQALLEALERHLAASPKNASPDGALPKDPAVIGTLAGVRLKLRSVQGAQEAAALTLAAACRRMLRTEAFEDADSTDDPEVQATVASIGSRVPAFAPFSATIDKALSQMERTADPAARAAATGTIRGAIKSYRSRIDAEPLLRLLEDSEAGSFAIHSTLATALAELDGALA